MTFNEYDVNVFISIDLALTSHKLNNNNVKVYIVSKITMLTNYELLAGYCETCDDSLNSFKVISVLL